MNIALIGLLSFCSFSACAAMGGWIAHLKHRQPIEGVALGLVLGPLGLVIESRLRAVHRPVIDPAAYRSFRSMTGHPRKGDVYPDNTR